MSRRLVTSGRRFQLLDSGDPPLPTLGNTLLWDIDSRFVTLNGSDVSDMEDQSGQGDANRDLTQATASAQPEYTASNANFNGKPTVDFVDGAYVLKCAGTWSAAVTQSFTLVTVASYAADTGRTQYPIVDDSDTFWVQVDTSGDLGVYYGGGLPIDTNAPTGNASIMGFEINGGSSKIYVDSTTASVTGGSGANGFDKLTIGNYNTPSASYYQNGSLARILVYDGVLSAGDLSTLFTHLSLLYGVTVS